MTGEVLSISVDFVLHLAVISCEIYPVWIHTGDDAALHAGCIQELEFSRRLSVDLAEIESNAYQKNAWYALRGTANC